MYTAEDDADDENFEDLSEHLYDMGMLEESKYIMSYSSSLLPDLILSLSPSFLIALYFRWRRFKGSKYMGRIS